MPDAVRSQIDPNPGPHGDDDAVGTDAVRTGVGIATGGVAMAGVATTDITPAWPVMQGGFGQRTGPATGTLDRIAAKALYLRSGPNSADAILLITADLIAIPRPLAEPVIESLVAATGLERRQICICASHTHSGPLPHDPGGSPGAAEYAPVLRAALIEIGVAAVARARPCRVGTGVGSVDVFFNRRTRGTPNLVDPRVPVIAVEDAGDGHVIAVVFGVGCHPVTLGWDNTEISGDFPGVAQRRVEELLGADAALFFNTTEANVIPVTSPDRDALDPRGYMGGSYDDTLSIGTTIAAEVVRVVRMLTLEPVLTVGAARSDVTLPAKNAAFDLASAEARLAKARDVLGRALGEDFEARANGFLWALASRHVVEQDLPDGAMRRVMIACCEVLGLSARVAFGAELPPVSVPVQVVRVNGIEFVALPGEPLVEVGLDWIRRTNNPNAFVVGLANAHLRYLPMLAHHAMADAATQYDTVTAGLEPGGVEQLLDVAGSLLSTIR